MTDKLQDLRERVKRSESQGIVISALDEVAWLFNIRGCDVSYNPVVIAFAFVTLEEAFLYVDSSKVSSEVRCYDYYRCGSVWLRTGWLWHCYVGMKM